MSQPAEPWGLSAPVRELLAGSTTPMTPREIAQAVNAYGCEAEVRVILKHLMARGLVVERCDTAGAAKRYVSIAYANHSNEAPT